MRKKKTYKLIISKFYEISDIIIFYMSLFIIYWYRISLKYFPRKTPRVSECNALKEYIHIFTCMQMCLYANTKLASQQIRGVSLESNKCRLHNVSCLSSHFSWTK